MKTAIRVHVEIVREDAANSSKNKTAKNLKNEEEKETIVLLSKRRRVTLLQSVDLVIVR